MDKETHPERLNRRKDAKEEHLARNIGNDAQSRELFLLKDLPLTGNLTPRVIGPHEREEDHLKHHNARNEAADLASLDEEVPRLGELLDDIQIEPHAEITDLRQPVPSEESHEAGEAENKPRLQPELGMAAKEDLHATLHQSGKLGEHSWIGGIFTAVRIFIA